MEKFLPPKPSALEVNKYLNRWENLEGYTLQEKALKKLFLKLLPGNSEISDILLKASCLNDFYSTNIFLIYPVAKKIFDLQIDKRLKDGDPSLVNDIADIEIAGKKKYFYSFASKFCSHHNALKFPIYDYFVETMLWHFQETDKFSNFKRKTALGL